MTPRSWVNECIPNILWACILAATLERKHYLSLFRSVAFNTREYLDNYAELFLTHNFLSKFSEKQFNVAFRQVLDDEKARSALSALLLLDSLPDRHLWGAHLPKPTPDHWQILAKGVGACFNHQSEKATDIRWIKLAFFAIAGRIQFSTQQADLAESIRLYPDKGDMRIVRPMIRATEISLRMMEFGEDEKSDLPAPHQDAFWEELHKKTRCLPLDPKSKPEIVEKEKVRQLINTANMTAEHFHATLKHTGLDARHDSSFGLVLYGLDLIIEAASSYSHSSAVGRSILRSIVECFITLSYLVMKDDPALWLKHRDYGNGQTKLSLLKNLSADSVPRFIDIELLEALANEDQWLEFSDVNLGSWSNKNLRALATEVGVKDVYDAYYDLCSGYTHGHWSAIRDTSFTMCYNPLHRFHRIPAPVNLSMKSIIEDGIDLTNRMLDELNKIYPGLSHRTETGVVKKKGTAKRKAKATVKTAKS